MITFYIILAIHLIYSFCVARYYGAKKQLGALYTFLFCLFLTPFLGSLIVSCSRSKNSTLYQSPSKWKFAGGILLLSVGAYFLIYQVDYQQLTNQALSYSNFSVLGATLAVITWGAFCIQRSQGIGKFENSKTLNFI